MIVLIPIETAVRELHYKLYLVRELCNIGHVCYLGSKNEINFLCKKFSNYLYLDKGFHDGKSQNLFKTIKKRGGVIFSLDEEGGVDYINDKILNQRYKNDLFKYADKIFFWGDYQHTALKERIQFDDQCVVSGHPRFTLLQEEYLEIYKEEVTKIKSQFSNFILVNTNMSFGNNLKGDDFVINNYLDRFSNVEEIINFDKKKLSTIVDLCKKISNNLDINIVLRPHPEENLDTYKKLFSNYKNVSIVFSGSVIPWLLACEFLIHPDCTTAIESWILGKKAISVLPENHDTSLVTYVPIEVSLKTKNIIDIIDIIKNKTDIPKLKHEGELLYSRLTHEKNSFSCVVSETKKIYLISKSNKIFDYYLLFKSKVILLFKYFKKNKKYISLISEKKLTYFNEDNILKILNSFPANNKKNINSISVTKTLFKFKSIS
jgi:surface carbohydrate biosynthesis protein